MGKKKRMPGLYQRNGYWHIDKVIRGKRFRGSCSTKDYREAEAYLVHIMEKSRRQMMFGEPEEHTFEAAAAKYIKEGTKKSLERDIQNLRSVMPFIGHLPLRSVHMGTLQGFIDDQKKKGIKSGTVNRQLAVVKQVLNLCFGVYRDDNDIPWLNQRPTITVQDWNDKREGYPLSDNERVCLVSCMAPGLKRVTEFLLNTGLRSGELCDLRWSWQREGEVSVFEIPAEFTKNSTDKLLVCNTIAQRILVEQYSLQSEFVFPGKQGAKRERVSSTAWKTARKKAVEVYRDRTGKEPSLGFQTVRPHDLRHTFATELRKLAVSHETRKALLGHGNLDPTTGYSQEEVNELRTAVEGLAKGFYGENIIDFPTNSPHSTWRSRARDT